MSVGRLLILGGSRYTVRSVRAAKALGCEVIVTDRDPQAPGFAFADHHAPIDITDQEGTLELAQRHAVDGVLALTDFGVQTAAFVAERLGLPGISPEVAELATNKASMRRCWAAAGVPSVEFRAVRTLEEAERALSELELPVILKPADSRGGGSRGVRKVEHPSELSEALRFAQSFYDDQVVVIEEFVTGLEHSVETISVAGEVHILAISDKEKTPPPYRVDKSVIYPTTSSGASLQQLRDAVRAAVTALGIVDGPAHIELCSTAHGPRLFEVGARPGGGATPDPIVPHVAGVPVIEAVVRMALGRPPGALQPRHSRGCVYRFLTPPPGRLVSVDGLEEVRAWPGVLDCDVLVRPGGEVRPVRVGGDRAGFVVAAAETRAQALDLANRAEASIRFHYS